MNCFTAKACSQRLPLLSITLQGYTSFRRHSLHSVHFQPPASAIHARVLPLFHYAQANPPFYSAPLWLPQSQPGTQSQNGNYIPPNPIRSIAFIHHPCFSQPNQWSVLQRVQPLKSGAPVVVALFSLYCSFHHAIEMRITAHTPPNTSYFPFQQHIIIMPEI